jgi:DNA-binding response OmpR family regulator
MSMPRKNGLFSKGRGAAPLQLVGSGTNRQWGRELAALQCKSTKSFIYHRFGQENFEEASKPAFLYLKKDERHMENHIKVLLIEDDEDDYILVKGLLSRTPSSKFDLDWVSDYDAGLEGISKHQHDVYLLDYRLGEQSGLDLLHELRHRGDEAPVIFFTGQGGYEIDVEAMLAGAADYLIKGQISADMLERAIRYTVERKHAKDELRLHHDRLEDMVQERTAQLEQANEMLRIEIAERKQLISQLREALARVKTLSGLLPICAWCKKIRDDKGYWNHVEAYIADHSEADFTHGICPDCADQLRRER